MAIWFLLCHHHVSLSSCCSFSEEEHSKVVGEHNPHQVDWMRIESKNAEQDKLPSKLQYNFWC